MVSGGLSYPLHPPACPLLARYGLGVFTLFLFAHHKTQKRNYMHIPIYFNILTPPPHTPPHILFEDFWTLEENRRKAYYQRRGNDVEIPNFLDDTGTCYYFWKEHVVAHAAGLEAALFLYWTSRAMIWQVERGRARTNFLMPQSSNEESRPTKIIYSTLFFP